MNRIRLDKLLHLKKLAPSRSQAQLLIKEGYVFVEGVAVKSSSTRVEENSNIEMKKTPYFSKGGLKLEGFLEDIDMDIKGKVCLDIGASTGGFTQYLLNNGAEKIYAVDVGKGQLHESLLQSSKVENYENTDIRDFKLDEEIDIITVDVSFISIKKIINDIKRFSNLKTKIIILIKPQFEVGKEFNKKGVVTDFKLIKETLSDIQNEIVEHGFNFEKLSPCKLKGKEGNQEFFAMVILREED